MEKKIGRYKEICRREYNNTILYDIIVLPEAEQLVEVHPRPVEGHQSIRHNEGDLPVHTHTLLQSIKYINFEIYFITYNQSYWEGSIIMYTSYSKHNFKGSLIGSGWGINIPVFHLLKIHLVLQLVSLEVGQFVLCPVLELVVSHECHHPRLLVLEPTTVNVNSNLILTIKKNTHFYMRVWEIKIFAVKNVIFPY